MGILNAKKAPSLIAFALAVALGLAACGGTTGGGGAYGGGATSASATATTAPSSTSSSSSSVKLTCATGAEVCTKTVTVSGASKTVLADTNGMTLYYFTPDTATTIACTGSCAATWPPLLAASATVTGTNLSGKLTVLNGAAGNQVLYNGHPLYTYAGDTSQADARGEGIGGKWYVVTPDLAASNASGGSGY